MKKVSKSKVQLSKETLANLNERDFVKVAAGDLNYTIAVTECYTDCACPNTQ
jgi:hypothetical protein